MKLTAADIAEITRLLDESRFSDLKLQIGEFRLRITRGGSSARYDDREEEATPAPGASPAAASPPAVPASAPGGGEVDVPAPLLGNFYHAPRPGDDPFVKPGDRVEAESVIGIIEVMKLMNSVRAGVSGTVVAILAPDGKPVEEGQPILRVKAD